MINPQRIAGLLFLVILSAAVVTMIAFRTWHLGSNETIILNFDKNEKPALTDLGLLSGKADYSVQICCHHSTSVTDRLSGARGPARKFEVRNTDALVRGSYRSELRIKPNYLHDEVWYQARILVPADWRPTNVPVVALQWHNTRDFFLGEKGTIPPLVLDVTGPKWRIVKAWDSRWISTAVPPRVEGHRTLATVTLQPGKWTEWTFRVRWSPKGDGLLQVWKDGRMVVDQPGAIGHQDLIGPYMKAGVYIPPWTDIGLEKTISKRALYFDTIAASPSRYGLPIAIPPTATTLTLK